MQLARATLVSVGSGPDDPPKRFARDSPLEEAGFEHLVLPKTPSVPAVILGSEERQSLDAKAAPSSSGWERVNITEKFCPLLGAVAAQDRG
jgi:hypothetical protein